MPRLSYHCRGWRSRCCSTYSFPDCGLPTLAITPAPASVARLLPGSGPIGYEVVRDCCATELRPTDHQYCGAVPVLPHTSQSLYSDLSLTRDRWRPRNSAHTP